MGLITLICQQCNGEIQLDENRETGFCQYCGTKVIIYEEKKKLELSGKIKVDNEDYYNNCVKIANTAFLNKNYEEAYNYYLKVLEINIGNSFAIFRKGLCTYYIYGKIEDALNGFKECEKENDYGKNLKKTIIKDLINLYSHMSSICLYDEKVIYYMFKIEKLIPYEETKNKKYIVEDLIESISLYIEEFKHDLSSASKNYLYNKKFQYKKIRNNGYLPLLESENKQHVFFIDEKIKDIIFYTPITIIFIIIIWLWMMVTFA